MYTPIFNSVLVEIDDEGAGWGSGNSDAMLGDSYSKGKVIAVGNVLPPPEHPLNYLNEDGSINTWDPSHLKGCYVMWNEGVEAGTTWDEDGKKYGFIYWWDVRGVKVDDGK